MKNDPYIRRLLSFWAISWVLTGFIVYFMVKPETRHPQKRSDGRQFENTDLQDWYAWDNEGYFGNRLPKEVSVRWTNLPDDMGSAQKTGSGWIILMDRRTNVSGKTAQMTLHHEECHIKTDLAEELDHGEMFQTCMMDLARQGAFHDLW